MQKLNSSILDILNNTIIKIKKRGNVEVGDKSILDVYVPIFNYLENNNQYQIDNLMKLIDDSVNKTKLMEANVGRAKFLETKGVGVIDPGALSTSIILKEFLRKETMKKIFNNKANIVNDMLSGYVKAHSDRVRFSETNQRIIIRSKNKNIDKVPLLIGNGSGHEPIALGWIGEGLLDANIVGDIFAAPSGDLILEGLKNFL